MHEIIQKKIDFYDSISNGDRKLVANYLNKHKISILPGFMENSELVKLFYKTYYHKRNKRVVLCGINPGRLGAGKTGVPFLDFKSLSALLTGVNNSDSERSAQFIFSVISKFGYASFFDNVYLTNISWFGFLKDGKNLNYYKMGDSLQNEFINGFMEEMDIVNPSLIIPLSKDVEKSLKKINKNKYKISDRLPHPNYCSFKSRCDDEINHYVRIIGDAIEHI